MAISVVCPGCSSSLKVKNVHAGKTVACPDCEAELVVPLPSASKAKSSVVSESATKFCHECGEQIRKKARICPECGVEQPRTRAREDDGSFDSTENVSGKKMAAGLCAIFLGGLGIHKFILGFTTAGVIMLVVSLLTCGLVMWPISLIEGIIYLTKSDEDFERIYLIGKKEWF